MARKLLFAGFILIVYLGWVTSAWAVELNKLSLTDEGKKLILRFDFSEPVQYEKLSYFDANFLSLTIKGLKFSTQQTRTNQLEASDDQMPYYKYVSLRQGEGSGEIRVYMGKRATPADALPVNHDNFIEVEILKPLWKQPETEPLDSEAGNGEAEESFIPDRTEDMSGTEPDEESTEPVEEWPDLSTEAWPANGGNEPAGGDAVETPVANISMPDRVSYRDIDFSAIPIPPIRLVDVPFREALMQMVSEAGYNVVVGNDLDNTSVVLDFRQQEMSLKEAFDVMRLAYDVEYLIEDYSIVFRKK